MKWKIHVRGNAGIIKVVAVCENTDCVLLHYDVIRA
jgi:hypothetical protein